MLNIYLQVWLFFEAFHSMHCPFINAYVSLTLNSFTGSLEEFLPVLQLHAV
jgi:hypothetical protein